MELELRDNEGNYMFSMTDILAIEMSRYLFADYRITSKTKQLNGKSFNCYCNETNETIGINCKYVKFILKPGYYVKIM